MAFLQETEAREVEIYGGFRMVCADGGKSLKAALPAVRSGKPVQFCWPAGSETS